MTEETKPETPRCTCAEMRYIDRDGKEKTITHPRHNCQDVRDRNALIPIAVRLAERTNGRTNFPAFIEAMDELWADHLKHTPKPSRKETT